MLCFSRLWPFERQVDNHTGPLDLFQGAQCRTQHRQVSGVITRTPNVLSKGMFDGCDTRNPHRGSQGGDVRQADGAETRCFDLSLRQSHGPAADRSAGNEYDKINPFVFEMLNDGRDAFPQHGFWLQQIPHDRIM
jgi:hypothetical protein